jgi:hypothetical protein
VPECRADFQNAAWASVGKQRKDDMSLGRLVRPLWLEHPVNREVDHRALLAILRIDVGKRGSRYFQILWMTA